jgi:hypothetical protein
MDTNKDTNIDANKDTNMNLTNVSYRPERQRPHRLAWVLLAGVPAGALLLSPPARSQGVEPQSVEGVLLPGECMMVEKEITLPELPPKLDLVLMVDLSGSYFDDIGQIQGPGGQAAEIADALEMEGIDLQLGLATFVDFPCQPWGAGSDYAYMRNQDLTSDIDTWQAAVDAMTIFFGFDAPESQYEGLWQALTGAGRDISDANAQSCDSNPDIPAGQGFNFRPDATRVIAFTTDAPFHVTGDAGPFPYPGANQSDVLSALAASGVVFIGLEAPGADHAAFEALANGSGGSVFQTTSDSSDIAQAILTGLSEVELEVDAEVTCDPGVSVSYEPELPLLAESGDIVSLDEELCVDANIGDVCVAGCTIDFTADGQVVGTQLVEFNVDNVGPVIECNAPDKITPSEPPVSFIASAVDTCGGATSEIISYNCVSKNGKSKLASCQVSFQDSTLTINDGGGVGTTISWVVVAEDENGNVSQETCSTLVVNKK